MRSCNTDDLAKRIIIILFSAIVSIFAYGCSQNKQAPASGNTRDQASSSVQSSALPRVSGGVEGVTGSRRLYSTTDDNIRIGERLRSGMAERIEVDHPILGGTWVNIENGVTLEFTEEGYLNYDRRGVGGESNRFVYELFVDAVEVGVNSGGIISEFWHYTIDGNALNIHWSHGSGSFIRDGGNQGEVSHTASGGPLIEGRDETSWGSEDLEISLRFFQTGHMAGKLHYTKRNVNMDLGDLMGGFAGGFTGELTEEQERAFRDNFSVEENTVSYVIDENTINITFDDWSGDGHTERWAYQVSGDFMTIIWPDGSDKGLYRKDDGFTDTMPDAAGIIWNQDGWSIIGNWYDEDSGLFLELIMGGQIHYVRSMPETAEYWYTADSFPSTRALAVYVPDGRTQYWYYKNTNNMLCITWPDGSRTTFHRDGVMPYHEQSNNNTDDEPIPIRDENLEVKPHAPQAPQTPKDSVPDKDSFIDSTWIDDEFSMLLQFTGYGDLVFMHLQPTTEVHQYTYTLDEKTIIVNTGDKEKEQWSYHLNDDILSIIWPDGTATDFYRDGNIA